MKKILCLLSLMLCLAMQAHADIIKTSTTLPQNGRPEYLYTMLNGFNFYSNSKTFPCQEGDADLGLFAFYAVDGIDNAYYIYSYNAKKWLTYEKSENYINGKGFVKLSDSPDEYFRVNNYVSEKYDMSPYTASGNVADIYLNWYDGVSVNDGISLGLWEDNGSKDNGSSYTFYEYKFVYQAPAWNDYPIFFTNTGSKGWSTGVDTSNNSWIKFSGNDTFSLKAVVDVDSNATLSFKTDYWNSGERLELYVDGVKVKDTGAYYHSRDMKIFADLSIGSHEIEWRVYDCSGCYIKNIGVEKNTYFEVNLVEPGSLGTEILYNVDHLKDVRSIKITGPMNDDDWAKVAMLENSYFIDLSESEIKELPDGIFDNEFPFLHKVLLPEGLERIGDCAFEDSYLTHINFPSTLKSIGERAFSSSQLMNAVMNDSVTFIGDDAFYECLCLTDVHYPESMTWVPRGCFQRCRYMVNFEMHDNVHDIYGYAFELNHSCRHRVPKNLWNVYRYAFRGCAMDTLILPENAYIEEQSFRDCHGLVYAEFPTTYHAFNSTFGGSSPIYNCTNLETLVLKSPTVLGGGGKSLFLQDCPDDVVIKVPSFLVNLYKLDEYWYNYKIEGFNTAEIKDWTLQADLVMNTRERFDGKPNLTINSLGSIKLNGDVVQVFDTLCTKSYNYYSGTSNDSYARVLVNNDVTTIEGEYRHYYYVQGKYWYFVSMPFDFKVGDIVSDVDGVDFVLRRYDGAARAENGAYGNWRNYTAESVVTAGTGFILQTSADCALIFTALDNECKQNVVSNEALVKFLDANPSNKASDSGWNLVGNPWLCYFNIHALNFTAPITTYDVSQKKYNAYSIIDDDYAIAPNEAFFVQCPENIRDISFPATGRQLTSEITNQQSAPSRNGALPGDRQLVDVVLSCGEASDRTRVVFNDAACMGYESTCDASKFFATEGSCPQLYTIDDDGIEYAINERPYNGGNVQLGVVVAQNGKCSFSLQRSDAKEVVLFDKETGIQHNFANGDYNFYAEAGVYTGRFVLGATKNNGTTSIDQLGVAGVDVVAVDGCIEVNGAEGVVTVVAVDGSRVAEFVGNGVVPVAAGTYIVRTTMGSVKVVVK